MMFERIARNLFDKQRPQPSAPNNTLKKPTPMRRKKTRWIGLALIATGFISCQKDYNCVCGGSGDGPYVVVITASSEEEAQTECSPPGSDCELVTD